MSARSGCGWLIAGTLGAMLAYYSYTGKSERFDPTFQQSPEIAQQYALPELPAQIVVQETSLPTTTRARPDGGVDRIVQTDKIDFNQPFDIRTERYHLIKQEDNGFSRAVGLVGSLPTRAFFMDWDISDGPEANTTRRVLTQLENTSSISGITVRLGHASALTDTHRLFTEEQVVERNPWLARVLLGLPDTLLTEALAEFGRRDYYNPLTQTAVVYSDIPAIAFHEIGHHQDYQRWSTDWIYNLTSLFPPTMLYKEAQASFKYARANLTPQERYQEPRYLVPAYLTYLIAVGAWAVKRFANSDRK